MAEAARGVEVPALRNVVQVVQTWETVIEANQLSAVSPPPISKPRARCSTGSFSDGSLSSSSPLRMQQRPSLGRTLFRDSPNGPSGSSGAEEVERPYTPTPLEARPVIPFSHEGPPPLPPAPQARANIGLRSARANARSHSFAAQSPPSPEAWSTPHSPPSTLGPSTPEPTPGWDPAEGQLSAPRSGPSSAQKQLVAAAAHYALQQDGLDGADEPDAGAPAWESAAESAAASAAHAAASAARATAAVALATAALSAMGPPKAATPARRCFADAPSAFAALCVVTSPAVLPVAGAAPAAEADAAAAARAAAGTARQEMSCSEGLHRSSALAAGVPAAWPTPPAVLAAGQEAQLEAGLAGSGGRSASAGGREEAGSGESAQNGAKLEPPKAPPAWSDSPSAHAAAHAPAGAHAGGGGQLARTSAALCCARLLVLALALATATTAVLLATSAVHLPPLPRILGGAGSKPPPNRTRDTPFFFETSSFSGSDGVGGADGSGSDGGGGAESGGEGGGSTPPQGGQPRPTVELAVSVALVPLLQRSVTLAPRGSLAAAMLPPRDAHQPRTAADVAGGVEAEAAAAADPAGTECPLPDGSLMLSSYPEGLLFYLKADRSHSPTGSWGTLCSRGDLAAGDRRGADVACRQLGYARGAHSASANGLVLFSAEGSEPHGANASARISAALVQLASDMPFSAAWLACTGRERLLSECTMRRPARTAPSWAVPPCVHPDHDVVLRCAGDRDRVKAAREELWASCAARAAR